MISILLASYNGGEFLAQQIESILNQSVREFVLHICDDCSTDSSWAVIERYAQKYPEKIKARQNSQNSGGAKWNFMRMMIAHKDDYVMLSDQDDVWLPDKIEKTLGKMFMLENRWGHRTPALVHSDLRVVDRNLAVLAPSYRELTKADFDRTSLPALLAQNTLTGCTALYNRALADCLFRMPDDLVMHDWYLMLTAAAFGKIGRVDDATVLYRQHGRNVVGAKPVRKLSYKIKKLSGGREIKAALCGTYRQAGAFLDVFGERLTPAQIAVLKAYRAIPAQNKFGRWRTVCRQGILKNGLARKPAQFIFI
jgi:glycosyltransferase involved in cell wall biosynthesis